MRPDRSVVVAPEGLAVQALVEEGRQYAVYLHAPVGDGSFAARWTGRVDPPASGTYRLTTVSDDGVRLWLDGKLLIDNWADHAPTEDHGDGRTHGGTAGRGEARVLPGRRRLTARLKWTRPDGVTEVVPAESPAHARRVGGPPRGVLRGALVRQAGGRSWTRGSTSSGPPLLARSLAAPSRGWSRSRSTCRPGVTRSGGSLRRPACSLRATLRPRRRPQVVDGCGLRRGLGPGRTGTLGEQESRFKI